MFGMPTSRPAWNESTACDRQRPYGKSPQRRSQIRSCKLSCSTSMLCEPGSLALHHSRPSPSRDTGGDGRRQVPSEKRCSLVPTHNPHPRRLLKCTRSHRSNIRPNQTSSNASKNLSYSRGGKHTVRQVQLIQRLDSPPQTASSAPRKLSTPPPNTHGSENTRPSEYICESGGAR